MSEKIVTAFYIPDKRQLGLFLRSDEVCSWAGFLSERGLIDYNRLAPQGIKVRMLPYPSAGVKTVLAKRLDSASRHGHLRRWYRMLNATSTRLKGTAKYMEVHGTRPSMHVLSACLQGWSEERGAARDTIRYNRKREDRIAKLVEQARPWQDRIADTYKEGGRYHGD
jgi:hypothetical protein